MLELGLTFLVGASIGHLVNVFYDVFYISGTIFLCLLLCKILADKDYFNNSKRHKMSFRVVIILAVFSAGLLLGYRSQEVVSPTRVRAEKIKLSGEVKSVVREVDSQKVIFSAENPLAPGEYVYTNVYVSPTSVIESYDKIEVNGSNLNVTPRTPLGPEKIVKSYETRTLFYSPEIYMKRFSEVSVKHTGKTFWQQINQLPERFIADFSSTIGSYTHEPYTSVALGISVGRKEFITDELEDKFRNSGLIHVMVLSGFNVSFMIIVIWIGLARLGKGLRFGFTLVLTWLFILTTGLTAPALRSGLMSSYGLVAEYFGRRYSAITGLVFSLFILSLVDTSSLFKNPSLHLSYLACFGLLVQYPVLRKIIPEPKKKHTVRKFIYETLLIILSVSLVLDVYIWSLTGKVSLLGGLLTALVEPVVSIGMILTYIVYVLDFISSMLASLAGILLTTCLEVLLFFVELGSNVGTINISISKSSALWYYAFLLTFDIGIFVKCKLQREVNIFDKIN